MAIAKMIAAIHIIVGVAFQLGPFVAISAVKQAFFRVASFITMSVFKYFPA